MAVTFSETQTTPNQSSTRQKQSFLDSIDNFLIKISSIPAKDKLFFIQNLSVMLRAGISLSLAVSTLAKQAENKKLKMVLTDIATNVEKGVNFAESLRKHQKIFGELFVNMIEAGEISGKLEGVLSQLYIQMKAHNELKSKIKSALTYPTIILLVMAGIGVFMIVVIIPQMTSMFKELNAELPLPTKILISVSDTIVQNGLASIIIAASLLFAFIKIIRTKKGRYFFQLALLKMPIISPIIKKINLAQFARTMSSLLKTDIMIVKTFQITANTLGNVHYKDVLLETAEKIKKGDQISKVLGSRPDLFPLIVSQMISVGEETGELDSILEELASFYENEVNQIMSNLPSIIEPLLMLAMGIGVGGMAIAIIMPMYSLSSSI